MLRSLRSVSAVALLATVASFAGASEKALPGFDLLGGVYVPKEPYKEGEPRATGLQQPWREMPSLDRNPVTPAKAELGKLLFYDPIVSGDNKTSCAHCHHPDFGFSDGRKTAMGFGGEGFGPERAGGEVLPRNSPSLWNAAYNPTQFWDGRAEDLEAQAHGPITAAGEMNEQPERLVGEVAAIPEYVELFKKAFDGGEVTYDRIREAIATYERTLLAFNTKFDRYAAGDPHALDESEKRGLRLFRSLKTRCFECHTFPNFSDGSFRVVGVPREDGTYDPGRAGVPGQGPFHAMKVPTLRNVALNAPYMHNGSLATLQEVVDFYSKGGGHQFKENPVAAIDDKMGTFDLTPQEKTDLVAFMHALTDTSLLPVSPTKVPSGLPVVTVKSKAVPAPPLPTGPATLASDGGPTDSAAPAVRVAAATRARGEMPERFRERARTRARVGSAAGAGPGSPVVATIAVWPGQSIQAAIDRAMPGDRVEVYPGVYNQTLTVDRDGVNLIGVEVDGERPVLDGMNQLADALQGTGRDFLLEGFHIRNYQGNGVVNNKTENVTYRDLVVENTGLYGLYPVEVVGVTIEDCVVSGSSDAGIYVGQSRDIVVRGCEVFNNVAGIEIENSVNALVTNNSAHHNTAGILVFVLPNNPSKIGTHCRVVGNRAWANNHPNFAKKGTIVSFVPSGIGMLVMAADHTEVTNNDIFGNDSQGIVVLSFLTSQAKPKEGYELDIEPHPDNNLVHANRYRDNGGNPAAIYKAMGLGGADVMWDGNGTGNGFREAAGVKTVPETLPTDSGLTPAAAAAGQ